MMFADRNDAGRRLLAPLAEWRGRGAVVLALPRGGVPVATEIARGLEAGLDLLIVRKIGLPQQPELAMGAVVDMAEPTVVRNEQVIEAARVTEAQFDRVRDQEIAELRVVVSAISPSGGISRSAIASSSSWTMASRPAPR